MAGVGPPPKRADLRQRANRKAGASTIAAPENPTIPDIPNPDARIWHPLTIVVWTHAWQSPMASKWIDTDIDALGRLALLWDEFYTKPDAKVMAEIRLQEQRFGLSPLDRSRLQWEVEPGRQAEQPGRQAQQQQTTRRADVARKSAGTHDPRHLLAVVK